MANRLLLSLNYFSETPLYQQIANEVEQMILSGRLHVGEKLPSVRKLSAQLRVSTVTVRRALEILVASKRVNAKNGSGFFVEPGFESRYAGAPDQQTSSTTDTPLKFDFRIQPHPTSAFEASVFMSKLRGIGRAFHTMQFDELDPLGQPQLRSRICSLLKTIRNIECSPEQIMVVASKAEAMNLLTRACVRENSAPCVAVVKTDWRDGAGVFPSNSRFCYVDLVSGLNTDDLAQPVDLIYLCPTTRTPVERSLSVQECQQILSWAVEKDALLIEDDWELGIKQSKPSPESLSAIAKPQGADRSIVYLGSLSMFVGELLPIGFIVVPEQMLAKMAAAKWQLNGGCSLLAQLAASELLSGECFYEVRNNSSAAIERKAKVAEQCLTSFPDWLALCRMSDDRRFANVEFKIKLDDCAVEESARRVGVAVTPMSELLTSEAERSGVILDLSAVDAETIDEALTLLYRAILECACTQAE